MPRDLPISNGKLMINFDHAAFVLATHKVADSFNAIVRAQHAEEVIA